MERHAPYYAAPAPGQLQPPQQPQHYTQQPPQQPGNAPLYVQPPPGLAALPNYPPPDRLPAQQTQQQQQGQQQQFGLPLGVAYSAPGPPAAPPSLGPWGTHQPYSQVQQPVGIAPGPAANAQAPWAPHQQQTQQPLQHQQQHQQQHPQQQQQMVAAGFARNEPGLQASQPTSQQLGQGQQGLAGPGGRQHGLGVHGGQTNSAPLDSPAGGPADPRPRPARSHYSSKPLNKEQLERQQQKAQEQEQQRQQAGNGAVPPLGAVTQQAQQAAPVPRYISNMPPPVSAPGATPAVPGNISGASGGAGGGTYPASTAMAGFSTTGPTGYMPGSAAVAAPPPGPTLSLANAHAAAAAAAGAAAGNAGGLAPGGYPPSPRSFASSAAAARGRPTPPVPGRAGVSPSGAAAGGGGGVSQGWANGPLEAPAPARSDRAPLILSDRALAPTAGAKRAFESLGFSSEGFYQDHKRQGLSPRAAGSSQAGGPEQQQQQMPRGPDTVFRLVLNLNDTALLIGKGGGTVRQIERETGARVKRLQEPPGCSEQVVVIWSPPSAGGEGERVNSAQRGLLDCCSRVLLAQNPPSVAGTQGRLQMLINRTQELAVVGRGGATISRVRAESKAGVRVMLPHQLPPCALNNDLLVEVEGDAAAILKAVELLGVLLRESPPTEKPGGAPPSFLALLSSQQGPPPGSSSMAAPGGTGVHMGPPPVRGFHIASQPAARPMMGGPSSLPGGSVAPPGMAPLAASGAGAAGGLPPGFGGPGTSLSGHPHVGGGGSGFFAGGGGLGGAPHMGGGGGVDNSRGAPAYPPGFGPPGTSGPSHSGASMRPMQRPLPPQQPPPSFGAGRGPPPPPRPPPPGPPGAGFAQGFAPPPPGRGPMQPPPPRPMGPPRPPGYAGIPPGGYY